jgi:hypothetical protein
VPDPPPPPHAHNIVKIDIHNASNNILRCSLFEHPATIKKMGAHRIETRIMQEVDDVAGVTPAVNAWRIVTRTICGEADVNEMIPGLLEQERTEEELHNTCT